MTDRLTFRLSRRAGDLSASGGGSARPALVLALLTIAALFAACGGDNGDGATPAPSVGGPASGDSDEELVELQLTAENQRFDKDRLQAPAGSEVSLTVDNRDSAEHTFSLYPSEGSADALFKGEPFAGPSFLTYQFPAPETPGTYHFQCDIHPDTMKGEFIAQ
jgi:plastocyanin